LSGFASPQCEGYVSIKDAMIQGKIRVGVRVRNEMKNIDVRRNGIVILSLG